MLFNFKHNPFTNLPWQKQHSLIVMCIFILAIIAFIFNDQLITFFVYQRQLIAQGELWRLITGHFFHTNGVHLLLNLTGLLLLWALHGHFYTLKNYSCLFVTTAITCSLCLYYFSVDISQYVGLSGVLHAIFIFGAIMDIRHQDKTGYLLFLGIWLKVAHEQFYGASEEVSSLIDAHIAIDAHLWGALSGLAFSVIYLFRLKNNKKIPKNKSGR